MTRTDVAILPARRPWPTWTTNPMRVATWTLWLEGQRVMRDGVEVLVLGACIDADGDLCIRYVDPTEASKNDVEVEW